MSWLSSLQDGLKNAETLLNAVDQKVNAVAATATETPSPFTPNSFDAAGQDLNLLSVTKGAYSENKRDPKPRRVEREKRGASRKVKSENTSRNKQQARTKVASSHTTSKPSPVVEKKTFDDLTAVLNTSEDEEKEKKKKEAKARTPSRIDPRTSSPRQGSRNNNNKATAAAATSNRSSEVAASPAGRDEEKAGGKPTILPSPPPAFPLTPTTPTTATTATEETEESKGESQGESGAGISQQDEEQSLSDVPGSGRNPKEGSELLDEGHQIVSVDDTTRAASVDNTGEGNEKEVRAVATANGEYSASAAEESKQPPMPGAGVAESEEETSNSRERNDLASSQAVSEARTQMRMKLEKEIQEAESLSKLRTNNSAGTATAAAASSKEARLSAMCERLSGRLQQYKMENEQLEEMLKEAEKERENVEKAAEEIEQHRKVLAAKENEISELQLRLEEAVMAKEIGKEELLSLKGQHDELAKQMSNSEIRVLSAAREELNAYELRFETERKAHKATKDAALKREQDLEALVAENTTALASMQQSLDERSERVAYLENMNASLEQDYTNLTKEIAANERQQKSLASSRAETEMKVQSLQQTIQDMQVKIDGMTEENKSSKAEIATLESELGDIRNKDAKQSKEDDQSASAQHKLNEMTDLLYLKQAQLEKLTSDKAAIQMSLEKEVNVLKQELKQTKSIHSMTSKRPPAYDIEEVVPIESIGPVYDRLAKNRRVGNYIRRGAQALDFSTSTVVGLLKKQPVVRIGLFVYIISIHFFLYFMMSRLQSKAIRMEEAIRSYPSPTQN